MTLPYAKAVGKIKCWVVFCEEYPKGIVYEDRNDALDFSKDMRVNSLTKGTTYTRIKYYTREELETLPEAD